LTQDATTIAKGKPMTTSAAATSAHAALREATQALSVRRDAHADLTETDFKTLAADLADTLGAVASLLRAVSVGVAPNATTHGLLVVADHVDIGALMAQAGGNHGVHTRSAMHVEPERCGCTDD
jgi:hypothetical protein